jgi:diguanylate cyclase (GGDEF)-like protein
MHSQLLHETTHDNLTGLARREFERHISEALASARQPGLHHTLYTLNLNQFSVVNETFGYSSGDELLVEITSCCAKSWVTDPARISNERHPAGKQPD